jgi:hypothetical protein
MLHIIFDIVPSEEIADSFFIQLFRFFSAEVGFFDYEQSIRLKVIEQRRLRILQCIPAALSFSGFVI